MSLGNIVDKMVMVKLNCSYDTGYRQCDQARTIVTEKTECETSMLKTGVTMYSKHQISPFTRALSELRTYYMENTLPWDTKSWRVIPSSKYQDFKNGLENLISECNDKFEEVFVDDYDKLKEAFEDSKGELEVEFPSSEDIAESYNIEYDMGAAASTNDIRIQGIDQEARRELKESMEKQYGEKIQDGLADIASRLSKAAHDIGSRCLDEDQNGKKYKRSLENIQQLSETVSGLNITGDQRIKDACKTIDDDICQWSSEAIKTTPKVRTEVAQAASSIKEALSTISL